MCVCVCVCVVCDVCVCVCVGVWCVGVFERALARVRVFLQHKCLYLTVGL